MPNTIPLAIVLIGMPGSGKSTCGQALASVLGKPFIDSDQLIEEEQQRSFQSIVDAQGYRRLRAIEERILLKMPVKNQVIATGGSAVYSAQAMDRLQAAATIIYLKCSLATLQARINNLETRGLAKDPEQDFAALYEERRPLYERYATHTLSMDSLTVQQAVSHLAELVI